MVAEQCAQLGAGARLLLEQCPADLDDWVEVDPSEAWRVVSVAPELRFEDRLDERPEQQAVVCRHEVDCAAHDADPHDLASLEQLRQRLRPEGIEPRPECGIGVVRHLRLHADEVLHRRVWCQRGSLEQQLARQRRPIQCPPAEHLVHAAILAHAAPPLDPSRGRA